MAANHDVSTCNACLSSYAQARDQLSRAMEEFFAELLTARLIQINVDPQRIARAHGMYRRIFEKYCRGPCSLAGQEFTAKLADQAKFAAEEIDAFLPN